MSLPDMSSPEKSLPENLFTIYGRKPVLEALEDDNIRFFRLHLAQSNRDSGIIKDILSRARQREIDIVYHDRMALSRISKNKKQDQGVAADILADNFQSFDNFLTQNSYQRCTLLALDNVTNPQNLGMIIRSVCAGYLDALLLPKKGCAKLDPLVIKASAGTLFKTRILRCDQLAEALANAQQSGFSVYSLAADESASITETALAKPNILVLGNESEGVSKRILQLSDGRISIPMNNGVESLNVSVVAGILSFMPLLKHKGAFEGVTGDKG